MSGDQGPLVTVVGVVNDVRFDALDPTQTVTIVLKGITDNDRLTFADYVFNA